jgi:hypothetical protein
MLNLAELPNSRCTRRGAQPRYARKGATQVSEALAARTMEPWTKYADPFD